MRSFVALLGVALVFAACQTDAVVPEKLVGRWSPAYQMQYKTTDGTWGPWTYINTFAALPDIEFTAGGRFLSDGKEGAECCSAGNKFTVVNNTILFSEVKSCPQMSCLPCTEWGIPRLDSDTLVVEMCMTRSKFARVK